MFGGDCYPVELTWQQVPVMSCPRTRFPTRVPRSNSAPWTPHHQQRFVNMRPARYRQACCSTMLHCLLPLLLPFQYITGYVCVFTCPELNLKLFWSFIQSKPRILESFSQCDPITFDHVTDSLLRISPNSWTALRTVWGRDVVLKITMPLKRWRGIPSHSHPKKCAAAVLFEHSSLLKRICFPHGRGTNLTAPASGHMFAGPLWSTHLQRGLTNILGKWILADKFDWLSWCSYESINTITSTLVVLWNLAVYKPCKNEQPRRAAEHCRAAALCFCIFVLCIASQHRTILLLH